MRSFVAAASHFHTRAQWWRYNGSTRPLHKVAETVLFASRDRGAPLRMRVTMVHLASPDVFVIHAAPVAAANLEGSCLRWRAFVYALQDRGTTSSVSSFLHSQETVPLGVHVRPTPSLIHQYVL
jgi:hypothetical protein